MPQLFRPDEGWDIDEHGNVNWAMAWRKELQSLLTVTEQQDKAGADQEWYRQMLVKVRTGMMTPVMDPAGLAQAQHAMGNSAQAQEGEVQDR